MRVPIIVAKATRSQAKQHPLPSILSRSLFHHFSASKRCGFGIGFDIDGVVLRGESPIGGSPQAIRRLYDNSGALNIPFIFLTNGGGFPESKRALELSRILDVNILPLQVVQGHTPFKQLANVYVFKPESDLDLRK
uniref:Uncharacterized protein MANES_11G138500 n=1 Tax=Rhizophora mucronata TaxID=61149 RepID=A0A2P2NIZ6_RHIMU